MDVQNGSGVVAVDLLGDDLDVQTLLVLRRRDKLHHLSVDPVGDTDEQRRQTDAVSNVQREEQRYCGDLYAGEKGTDGLNSANAPPPPPPPDAPAE
jgi:hypothetical protein